MKKISYNSIAYFFYAIGTIDFVSANYFNNDFTGIPFSPIILGAIGSIFMFLHNSKIKESNNNVYEIFKFSLFAVLISDDVIDKSELEYSSSILNTLENEFLLPINPSKLEEEILNYDLNGIYDKIQNLQTLIPYRIKLNILSSCAVLCVMDGRIDEVEQESIYKISNILNISEIDMRNIFNASIASYIDFKNSDRDKLQINDSEVKKVVDEKKAENKSNKNQSYIGIGVFAALVVFGIYSSFQITTEESCDNIVLFYNNLSDIELSYLNSQRQAVDIWNEYFQNNRNDDKYFLLTSQEQKALHDDLNLYKIYELIELQTDTKNTFLEQDTNLLEIHKDHILLLSLFDELIKINIDRIESNTDKNYLQIEYIETIESYYYDWDNAAKQNDSKLIDSIEKTFTEYENIFKLNYEENQRQKSLINTKLDEIVLQVQLEAASYCNITFEN